ncbi:MAG: RluA family pseudouridine synthase [bacterium]
MKKKKHITAKENNIRLDAYLARELNDFSRTFIQKLIRDNNITLNGKNVSVKERVKIGDSIDIVIPPVRELNVEPEDIPLSVIYEDKDIIVVDKPAGMVVHPAFGNYKGTLVSALLYHCKDLSGVGGVLRPGIVHRLDKDTSGVMVAAKTDTAHRALAKQFLDHEVEKEYIALVLGACKAKYGKINVPVGRSTKDRKKMAPTLTRSRDALTLFKVIEILDGFSLLELTPKTGRTHQIRVHMSYIGHPVAGDDAYASGKRKPKVKIARQMLHAHKLSFVHPRTKKKVSFTAPLADDMEKLLRCLRGA